MNELLLIASMVFIFGTVLAAYRWFGRGGLYAVMAVTVILANIECMIVVDAFSMEQTLGNVLFAASFLITDILSENEGKRQANKAVLLGVGACVFFLIISASWLWYVPSSSDFAMPYMRELFSRAPRIMIASLSVYAVSQLLDVQLYHLWWRFTDRIFHDHYRYLWIRNNGSTLISQFLNTVLFNVLAFWGVYEGRTLVSIIFAGYAIFVITSICDTPAAYMARRIAVKRRASIREKIKKEFVASNQS